MDVIEFRGGFDTINPIGNPIGLILAGLWIGRNNVVFGEWP